jgi:hypothetical protein
MLSIEVSLSSLYKMGDEGMESEDIGMLYLSLLLPFILLPLLLFVLLVLPLFVLLFLFSFYRVF